MELKVNGNSVDITLEDEKTIGDVLKSFEEEASKNKATTINIKVDGKEITSEDFDNAIKHPIEDSTLIELTVISQDDILDSFAKSKKGIDLITTQMELVPVLLQSGKDSDVSSTIQQLANEIDTFCHVSTLCALFPDLYKNIKIDDKDIAEFFENFAPVLQEFEEALEAKDSVTVGDLAEYEISPRLQKISEAIQNILK